MNNDPRPLADLRDAELLRHVEFLAGGERAATAQLIAALAELDVRRLYLGEGFSSLFAYCTLHLRLSEHAAYGRIEAARVVRRFPHVLTAIADGSITLTNLCLLAPHVTAQNCSTLLAAAAHKTKREVERQVAALRPMPDAPPTVRKLPQSSTPIENPELFATPARTTIAPLSPGRYRLQFTIAQQTHDRLCHAQNLLRRSASRVDVAVVFDRALTVLIADVERKKLGRCVRGRPNPPRVVRAGSRHIPRAVRRDVWKRDGGQCAFVGASGRCAERGGLEYHHVILTRRRPQSLLTLPSLWTHRARPQGTWKLETSFHSANPRPATHSRKHTSHAPSPRGHLPTPRGSISPLRCGSPAPDAIRSGGPAVSRRASRFTIRGGVRCAAHYPAARTVARW
jgi:hypothetical protein